LRRLPQTRRLESVVVDAETDGSALVVHFAPIGGIPKDIADRILLGPRGELSAVHGVGRLLRILRAGRIRPPRDPYALAADLSEAVVLVQRCRGAHVWLHVKRRVERVLTVWTDAGVDRIGGVVDFAEDEDGLWVRRIGGQSVLRIPRGSLIRYRATSEEHPEVVSIEVPMRSRLH
jgi:hypothetical protein